MNFSSSSKSMTTLDRDMGAKRIDYARAEIAH